MMDSDCSSSRSEQIELAIAAAASSASKVQFILDDAIAGYIVLLAAASTAEIDNARALAAQLATDDPVFVWMPLWRIRRPLLRARWCEGRIRELARWRGYLTAEGASAAGDDAARGPKE